MTTIPMSSPSLPGAPLGPDDVSRGGRLVAVDGRPLLLEQTTLEIEARAGLARTVVEQVFVNPFDQPLDVSYLLPLPAEGAVSGFAFRLGEVRVVGEVDRRERARARYTEALAEGRSAGLIEQERVNLFTQQVGNIPPRQRVVCEVTVDQRLAWLDEGAWELRFPTVVGPRYMGEPGRVADAAALNVPIADRPLPQRLKLSLRIGDALQGPVEGTSHALTLGTQQGVTVAALAAGARLDRDVVVRWPVAAPKPGVTVSSGRPSRPELQGRAFGVVTLVPPPQATAMTPVSRDLIILIDTSGSMDGQPLDHARKVASALIEGLEPTDRLELIEFSSAPRRWRAEPVVATRDGKRSALDWLRRLNAGGSTEMHTAILEALRPLRPDAQRQLVLITDGYIGFEHQVLGAVMDELPRGSRVHCVGVGDGVNRALTQPVARMGGGVEVIIGIGDDAERVASRLLARTRRPLVTNLRLEGEGLRGVATARLPDLFAGAPSLTAVELAPGGGRLRIKGDRADGGTFDEVVEVRPLALGEGEQAAPQLFAREQAEDLEARRHQPSLLREADASLEALGLTFQIATRHTSWVAISDAVTVDPTKRGRRESVEHELVHGLSAEGVGLRPASAPGGGAFGAAFEGALFDAPELSRRARVGGAFPRTGGPLPPPAAAPAPARPRMIAKPTVSADAAKLELDDLRREPAESELWGDGVFADRSDADEFATGDLAPVRAEAAPEGAAESDVENEAKKDTAGAQAPAAAAPEPADSAGRAKLEPWQILLALLLLLVALVLAARGLLG